MSPLASLVATSQLKFGDFVRIDLNTEGCLIFTKEADGALSGMRDLDENEGGVPPIAAAANSSAATVFAYGAF